jgi:hypothetical protein
MDDRFPPAAVDGGNSDFRVLLGAPQDAPDLAHDAAEGETDIEIGDFSPATSLARRPHMFSHQRFHEVTRKSLSRTTIPAATLRRIVSR